MSNYLRHLLITKQLDITTNPEKPEKQCKIRYFHPILKEGEDESKKIQIKPYHICVVGTRSWFNHNAPAVDSMPCNCLQDLSRLLHFVNDWELDDNNYEWNKAFAFPKHDMITATMIMLLLIVSIDCRYYMSSDGRIVSSLANGLL